MTKIFRMEDLDCANCAAKMEQAIAKLDDVNSVKVNFISQKMTIEADEAHFDEVMQKVAKICRKIEPDCRVILP